MFKREKKVKNAIDGEPQKTPAEIEADKAIKRGDRIRLLSGDAAMWRRFAESCKPGRRVYEEWRMGVGMGDYESRLSVQMDEDTAPVWAAFARQMAEERERRLKDVLGI